jgi:hypothetical protein
MEDVSKMYRAVEGYQEEIRDFKAMLPTIIKNAIEDKATESGQVTATFVMDRLNEAFKGVTKKWDEAIESTITRLGFTPGGSGNGVLGSESVGWIPYYAGQELFPNMYYIKLKKKTSCYFRLYIFILK